MFKTVIFLIVGLIIYAIVSAYRKVDNKVDSYKIKRNPKDVSTLEKILLKNIRENKVQEAINICGQILVLSPNNLLANLYQAKNYHENKDYSHSGILLRKLALHLLDETGLRRLQQMSISFSNDKNWDIVQLLIAKAYYYNGHIHSLNGENGDSEKWKQKAKKYNRSVLSLNLY